MKAFLEEARQAPNRDLGEWLRNNPNNPLTEALASTPEGRSALDIEREYEVNLKLVPGTGSSHVGETNTVTIGAHLPFPQMQRAYIHEMNHVLDFKINGPVDPLTKNYTRLMLNKEAKADAPAIRHLLRRNGYRPSTPLEKTYWDSYKQGRDEAWARHPNWTPKQWHKAGLLRAHKDLVVALGGKGVVTSTTKVPYKQYFEKYQIAAGLGLATHLISPAPLMEEGGSPDQQAAPQSRPATSQEERASSSQRMDPSSTTAVPTTRIAKLEQEINELKEIKKIKDLESENISNTINSLKEKMKIIVILIN